MAQVAFFHPTKKKTKRAHVLLRLFIYYCRLSQDCENDEIPFQKNNI